MGQIDRSKYTKERALWTLKKAWQVGDTALITEWLAIEYIPTLPPPGLDLDEEWAFAVADVRKWIDDIYHRLYERVSA